NKFLSWRVPATMANGLADLEDRLVCVATTPAPSWRRSIATSADAAAPGPVGRAMRAAEHRPGMSGLVARLEACVPALRRYATVLSRDQGEADNLVHRCLVGALDRLHALGHDGELRVSLFTMVYRRVSAGPRRLQTD